MTKKFVIWAQFNKFDLYDKHCFCNGCSSISVRDNLTPPRSFQRFQICRDIVFLQLIFVNCIIRYTVDYRCTNCYSIGLRKYLFSFAE